MEERRTEQQQDVYSKSVLVAFETSEDIVEDLENMKASIDVVLGLLSHDEVKLVDADPGYGCKEGYLYVFETTEAELAESHDFDEVLRAGADEPVPAPWTLCEDCRAEVQS